MSFSTSDIADIKWNLGAFLVSLGIAAAIISYSEEFKHQALKDRQAAQSQLNDARAQLAIAQSDFENMATYKSEYLTLENQRIIGIEQRLDLIEGLEKIRKQGLVLDFKYAIGPQQSYTPNPPLDAGNYALNLSPMTLQIDLLHEEQLQHLFLAIQNKMQGWFILDRCSLTLGAAQAAGSAALKAECAGGWFTMKNRNAP